MSSPKERTYPAGVTSWVDLEVDDVAAAQTFYGGLFGWTFERMTPPDLPFGYDVVSLEGREVGGLGGPSSPTGGSAPARWNTYVATEDIAATVAAAEAAGAVILEPPAAAGAAGHSAALTDPVGARFSLWQPGYRQGAQVVNAPGAWNFSDLLTDDPDGAKAFYGSVFGWAFVEMGPLTLIQVPGYGDHLAATVDPGIHERQASAPPGFADVIGGLAAIDAADGLGGHWQVTFTVADRDESATKAESLGGTVLATSEAAGPAVPSHGTRRAPSSRRASSPHQSPSSGD
jgi:predicted enzyme related to lactoylglutathione lyase